MKVIETILLVNPELFSEPRKTIKINECELHLWGIIEFFFFSSSFSSRRNWKTVGELLFARYIFGEANVSWLLTQIAQIPLHFKMQQEKWIYIFCSVCEMNG